MLFTVLWNCLRGYVIIGVEGLSLERFLNIAVTNGIRVWGVRRLKYTMIRACVSEMGYRRLTKLLAEQRFAINVEKRSGLPALLSNAKRRFALAAGILLTAGVVIALSAFVWQVEITGTRTLNPDKILIEVRDFGGRMGALKSALDLEDLEKKLARNHPEIAWVNAEYEGVVLKLQIVEADMPPKMIENEGTADIICLKDALIRKVTVFAGRAKVKEGQTVKKGQLLIEGEIWEEGNPRMSFFARGSVIGSVWYAGRAKTNLYETDNKPTGRSADLRYIQIGNNLVLVGGDDTGFEKTIKTVTHSVALGENLFFPVKVFDVHAAEIKEEKTPRSLQEAKVEAEELAYRAALKKVPEDAKIVGFDTRYDMTWDTITATCAIETEEEIGYTKKTS
jgi:similar to stage IV sporulation protein